MRKDILLMKLIKFGFETTKDSRIVLLKQFFNTDENLLRNDDERITYDSFIEYLRVQHPSSVNLFNDDFLHKTTSLAEFFRKFKTLSSDAKEMKTERSNPPIQKCGSVFHRVVALFLDTHSIANLSGTCHFFYNHTKSLSYWRHKLFALDRYASDLLSLAIKTNGIRNYQRFYLTLARNYHNRPINELWDFLSVSGDPAALRYAVTEEGINKYTHNGVMNVLFWTALSGSVSAMYYAITVVGNNPSHMIWRREGYRMMIDYALDSGNAFAIKFAQAYCKANMDRQNQYRHRPKNENAINEFFRVYTTLGLKGLKAKPKLFQQFDHLRVMFETAVKTGSLAVVKHAFALLAPELQTDLNWILVTGATSGRIEILDYLLDSVNIKDVYQKSRCREADVLYASARSGSLSLFLFVLKFFEIPEDQERLFRYFPNLLEAAVEGGNLALLRYVSNFFQRNKYVPFQLFNVLCNALNQGNVTCIRYVTEILKINSDPSNYRSLYELVKEKGNPSAIKYFTLTQYEAPRFMLQSDYYTNGPMLFKRLLQYPLNGDEKKDGQPYSNRNQI